MWKTLALGEICDVLDSLRKPITKIDRVEGDYPYYGATGIVDWVHDYIFDEKLVLVGEDGAKWGAGDKTAFIATGKYWVNNHAHVLRPKPDLVMHEWISYYLTGLDLTEFVTGLTVPKLNQANLKIIPILLPPLAEQQRIVAKLDQTFAKIDKAINLTEAKETEIKQLQASLLSTSLNKEVGMWKTVKLGDVCELAYGKALDKKDRLDGDGIPAFGANGIKTYAKKSLYNEPSIIVGRKGSAGEIKKVVEPFWALDVTYYTRINKEIITLDFLFYTLTSLDLPLMARGVKPGINRNDVYNRNILLPPIDEQKYIVNKLDTAFAEIDRVQIATIRKKENYQALKFALLSHELPSEAL